MSNMPSENDPLLAPQDSLDDLRKPGPKKSPSIWHSLTTGTEIVVFTFIFYYAAVMPLLNQFIYVKLAEMMNYTGPLPNSQSNVSREQCEHMNVTSPMYLQQQELQSQASMYLYLNTVVSLVPCFFSCVFLGAYSDRAGRKIAMLLPIIGSIIKAIVFVFIIAFNLHVAFIFIGSFLDGCFGGMAVLLMACFSYVSDITTTANRSFRVIIIEICIGIGVIVSQTVFGVVISYLGYMWPFAMLAGLNSLLFIYVVFRVKETVIPSERVPFFEVSYFTKPLFLFIKDPAKTGRRPKLIISLLMIMIHSGTAIAASSIEMLKLMNSPLCWSSVFIGLFFGTKYFFSTAGTISLTKLCHVRFGDLKLVIVGCISGALYQLAFSFAVSDWQVFAGMLFTLSCALPSLILNNISVTILGMFSFLPVGLLRAYLSKNVGPQEVGSVFASVAWVELLGSFLSSLTYMNIYRATLTPAYLNGVVFQVIGLVYIIVMVTVGCLMLCQTTDQPRLQTTMDVSSSDSEHSSINA